MGLKDGLECGNNGCVGALFNCRALLLERSGRLTSVLLSCSANVMKRASDLSISEDTLHLRRALNAFRKWGKTSWVNDSPFSASRSRFMMPAFILVIFLEGF